MAYSDYGAFVYLMDGGGEWFEFSHHGVMGDGSVRVGCYKQGWPEVYEWEDGKDKPTIYTFDDLSRKFGWDDYEEYGDTRLVADEYDEEFDFLGWHFHFWGDDTGGTPRYGATMSREVAENLRNLTIGHFIQYKEQLFDELAEVVVGFEDYHDFDVVLDKLADLIDPEGGDDD